MDSDFDPIRVRWPDAGIWDAVTRFVGAHSLRWQLLRESELRQQAKERCSQKARGTWEMLQPSSSEANDLPSTTIENSEREERHDPVAKAADPDLEPPVRTQASLRQERLNKLQASRAQRAWWGADVPRGAASSSAFVSEPPCPLPRARRHWSFALHIKSGLASFSHLYVQEECAIFPRDP